MHAEVENYWRYSRLNQSSAIKTATSGRNVHTVVWEGRPVRGVSIPINAHFIKIEIKAKIKATIDTTVAIKNFLFSLFIVASTDAK